MGRFYFDLRLVTDLQLLLYEMELETFHWRRRGEGERERGLLGCIMYG